MRSAKHAKRLALDAAAPLRINGTPRERSWKGGELMPSLRRVTVCAAEGGLLTASLIEGVAVAFGSFIGRYERFFRTRTRDNAVVAERYLQGLAQAEAATFAAKVMVV